MVGSWKMTLSFFWDGRFLGAMPQFCEVDLTSCSMFKYLNFVMVCLVCLVLEGLDAFMPYISGWLK